MAEPGKVRLVRCPKCENLLPELADYSVYQCGGCGAVLRAKSKRGEDGTLSEKSDEEAAVVAPAKLANSSEKKAVENGVALDSDAKLLSASFRRNQNDDVKNGDAHRSQSNLENGDHTSSNRRDELGSSVARELKDLNSELGSTSEFRRSGRMTNWKMGAEAEGVRFSASNYRDDGPSNFQPGPSNGFSESTKKHDRAHYLEQDRAQLLKKLDELRDQLSRSCEVSDKPKENVPLDMYGGSDAWFPDNSSGSKRPFMQYSRPDKHVSGSPNYSHFPDPIPYNNGYEIPTPRYYSSVPCRNHIPFDDFGPHIVKGGNSRHLPRPYEHPSHPYFSGLYVDNNINNHDPFDPYSKNATFHRPSCPCYHCYENHRRASSHVQPSSFGNKRFGDLQSNPAFFRHETGQSDPYKPRTGMNPNLHASQSHSRWPGDLNHENGYVHARGRKVMYAGNRHFQPMGAGAPFFTCSNCFEVLKIPKKVRLMEKSHYKVKCGACSTIMSLAVIDKKIILSANSDSVLVPTDMNNGFTDVEDCMVYSHAHMNRSYTNFSSEDYDISGYDFQAMDRGAVLDPVGPGLGPSRPQEMQSFHSSSPCTSEDENSSEIPVAKRAVSNSGPQPIKSTVSPPPAGSPLQEYFEFSTNSHLVSRLGKGSQSSRSDQEKAKLNKITSRQNSLKEAALATEMEVSFNEYSNTVITQDSGDDLTRGKGDSFLANIIKKSFKDFSRTNHTDERSKCNVSVNGHPLTDRVVKKAQKSAGPIHPGHYWYDYRAGFWGVMGGPCLGIVLPYIEEFNYPLPENCAAGNTGVYVNGRELNQKDLDLLASRGLPTSRDRSYIVEISGRVLDEDTGAELDCLGKLAPTVEKAKHGFGMKAPKAVQPK